MKTIVHQFKTNIHAILLFTAISFPGMAQDTLNYRSGEQSAVIVTEISDSTVKYKRVENPDGPAYTDMKNDIASIRFKNGSLETFELSASAMVVEDAPVATVTTIATKPTPQYFRLQQFGGSYMYGGRIINYREMHNVLLSVGDKQIAEHIRTAERQAKGQYIGFGIFPLGIAALVMAGESRGFDDERLTAGILGTLGVACFATSITLKVKRTQHDKQALKLYQLYY